MQESCGAPLPESAQFERREEVANAGFPVSLSAFYLYLIQLRGR
jgi:hypothetical protein